MSTHDKRQTEQRAAYVTLSGMFMTLFAAFATRTRRREVLRLQPFDLLLLSLSTFRLSRLVSYDKVLEPYRAPFTETVPDASGAGKTTRPTGQGVRRAIGELLACPICSGTWIAAGLVYALGVAPNSTRAFLAIMSSIGSAEILNAAHETLQWTAQEQRREVGDHPKQ